MEFSVCDENAIKVPLRSHLYHLPPFGIGTPLIESITSYLTRLSYCHTVPLSELIKNEIMPFFTKTCSRNLFSNSHSLRENIQMVNGINNPAKYVVEILENLTLRNDLCSMNLMPWAKIISNQNLLRHNQVWCSLCFAEWEKKGQEFYEPLIWSLKDVKVCPIHLIYLRNKCLNKNCIQDLKKRNVNLRIGFCSYCDNWLGELENPLFNSGEVIIDSQLVWLEWVAASVGELLSKSNQLKEPLDLSLVAKNIGFIKGKVTQGSCTSLAKKLNMNNGASRINLWEKGNRPIKIFSILRLCFFLGLSPYFFLTNLVKDDKFLERNLPKNIRTVINYEGIIKRVDQPLDHKEIQKHIEIAKHEYPPPSIREVARRVGCTCSPIRKSFREDYYSICSRFQAYREEMHNVWVQKIQADVRNATIIINNLGIYPTCTKVAEYLNQPKIFRSPIAGDTRRKTLGELGWNKPDIIL